ncbi:hypothetical protein [Bacteroides sp.]|uniref:hypothetical protein n=1 Tax=Bacteroides sp. TaxID=29523 RepID=UPI001B62661F|nr:hypothetical protein [Bacteroides sp.]MBP6065970.1 hypothetical protein [Bacteroides sp.]MBP6067987.1 hypothetical protein [Bacteroides sp.]MBP6937106.1 hypothetical protein [Bacteroides sp.]
MKQKFHRVGTKQNTGIQTGATESDDVESPGMYCAQAEFKPELSTVMTIKWMLI